MPVSGHEFHVQLGLACILKKKKTVKASTLISKNCLRRDRAKGGATRLRLVAASSQWRVETVELCSNTYLEKVLDTSVRTPQVVLAQLF